MCWTSRACWPDPGRARRWATSAPKSSRSSGPGAATTRAYGARRLLKDREGEDTRDSAYYLCANRNKKSVAVDFTTAAGQALVREMVKRCDVVIENFKVGSLAQYGLDHASLLAVNPRLVYSSSTTGFGQINGGPSARAMTS